MKGMYVQTGDNLDYINPTEDVIEAGTVIALGQLACIAATRMEAGELGTVATVGVWTFPKDESDIKAGTPVYYDDSADKATTEQKDLLLGAAIADAGTEAAEVSVKLNTIAASGQASEAA